MHPARAAARATSRSGLTSSAWSRTSASLPRAPPTKWTSPPGSRRQVGGAGLAGCPAGMECSVAGERLPHPSCFDPMASTLVVLRRKHDGSGWIHPVVRRGRAGLLLRRLPLGARLRAAAAAAAARAGRLSRAGHLLADLSRPVTGCSLPGPAGLPAAGGAPVQGPAGAESRVAALAGSHGGGRARRRCRRQRQRAAAGRSRRQLR